MPSRASPPVRFSWEYKKAAEQQPTDRTSDCSIKGMKPTITPFLEIPETEKNKGLNYLQKKYPDMFRRCCCGKKPIKKATYPIQGAVAVQYYCDKCAERELPLH